MAPPASSPCIDHLASTDSRAGATCTCVALVGFPCALSSDYGAKLPCGGPFASVMPASQEEFVRDADGSWVPVPTLAQVALPLLVVRVDLASGDRGPVVRDVSPSGMQHRASSAVALWLPLPTSRLPRSKEAAAALSPRELAPGATDVASASSPQSEPLVQLGVVGELLEHVDEGPGPPSAAAASVAVRAVSSVGKGPGFTLVVRPLPWVGSGLGGGGSDVQQRVSIRAPLGRASPAAAARAPRATPGLSLSGADEAAWALGAAATLLIIVAWQFRRGRSRVKQPPVVAPLPWLPAPSAVASESAASVASLAPFAWQIPPLLALAPASVAATALHLAASAHGAAGSAACPPPSAPDHGASHVWGASSRATPAAVVPPRRSIVRASLLMLSPRRRWHRPPTRDAGVETWGGGDWCEEEEEDAAVQSLWGVSSSLTSEESGGAFSQDPPAAMTSLARSTPRGGGAQLCAPFARPGDCALPPAPAAAAVAAAAVAAAASPVTVPSLPGQSQLFLDLHEQVQLPPPPRVDQLRDVPPAECGKATLVGRWRPRPTEDESLDVDGVASLPRKSRLRPTAYTALLGGDLSTAAGAADCALPDDGGCIAGGVDQSPCASHGRRGEPDKVATWSPSRRLQTSLLSQPEGASAVTDWSGCFADIFGGQTALAAGV